MGPWPTVGKEGGAIWQGLLVGVDKNTKDLGGCTLWVDKMK